MLVSPSYKCIRIDNRFYKLRDILERNKRREAINKGKLKMRCCDYGREKTTTEEEKRLRERVKRLSEREKRPREKEQGLLERQKRLPEWVKNKTKGSKPFLFFNPNEVFNHRLPFFQYFLTKFFISVKNFSKILQNGFNLLLI